MLGDRNWERQKSYTESSRLNICVVLSKLSYLTSYHYLNMRLDKHVGAIQDMYNELIRCRQWSIHIDDILCHGNVTAQDNLANNWCRLDKPKEKLIKSFKTKPCPLKTANKPKLMGRSFLPWEEGKKTVLIVIVDRDSNNRCKIIIWIVCI